MKEIVDLKHKNKNELKLMNVESRGRRAEADDEEIKPSPNNQDLKTLDTDPPNPETNLREIDEVVVLLQSSLIGQKSEEDDEDDGEELSKCENTVSIPVIKLPENLEGLIRADHFPCQRHRWNTNEEIAAILISFGRHPEWLSKEVKIRPKSGSMLLYSRKKVRYRRDGYCWKKRKDGKTTREDHMKLKVQGTECIYGCYVHSAILPTFHRRCYWLLQNPDIVLVHYLNVPYPDDNKLIITSNVSMWGDKKEWTKDELISQLKPMFFSEEEPDLNNELEISTAETVESIVHQLMEKQRVARQAALLEATIAAAAANSQTPTSSSSLPTASSGLSPLTTTPASIPSSTTSSTNSNKTIITSTPTLNKSSSTNSNSNTHSSSTPSPLLQPPALTQSTASQRLSPGSTTTTMTVTLPPQPPQPTHTQHHHPTSSSTISVQIPHNIPAPPPAHHLHSHHHSSNHGTTSIIENQRLTLSTNPTSSTNGTGENRPFVLNLSQFQSAGGLIIVQNGKPALALNNHTTKQHHAQHHPQQQQQQQGSSSNSSSGSGAPLPSLQSVSNNGTRTIGSFLDIQNANNVHLMDEGHSHSHRNPTPIPSPGSNVLSNSNHHHHSHHQQHPQPHHQHHHQTLYIQQSHFTSSTSSSSSNNPPTTLIKASPSPVPTLPPQNGLIGNRIVPAVTLAQSQVPNNCIPNNSVQGPGSSGTNTQSSATPTPASASGYFHHETFDMSHEDIQQTLSANMRHIVDAGGCPVDLEPMSPSADDVFVNLDAFDILADFSEDLESHGNVHGGTHGGILGGTGIGIKNTIVDINPEWAYSEGGTKILIVGQFHNPEWDYTIHFGDLPVPAVYLQTGVLKCFCPPHSPGLVPIRVYSNGKQISSNSMVFEYKADLKLSLVPVPPSETSLKLCLIHRFESLEKCFRNFKSDIYGVKSMEDCLVKICYEMMAQDWNCNSSPNSNTKGEEKAGSGESPSDSLVLPSEPDRGLTLLHLTAGLGFTRLLLTLLQWKRENPSKVLDSEINPTRIDEFGLIPLMWCARFGHLECGVILAQVFPSSLSKRDSNGQNSTQIAFSRGFTKLGSELEKVQRGRSVSGAGGSAAGLGPGPPSLLLHTYPYHHPNSSSSSSSNNGTNNLGSSGSGKSPFGGRLEMTSSDFIITKKVQKSRSEDFGLKDCFFGQPEPTLELSIPTEEESRVLTLAEQIIAAMPERIKKESCEEMSPSCESHDSASVMSSSAGDGSDPNDFSSYEFTDKNYRYYDSGTPCSSLSPSSSSCLQSPSSSFTLDSPQPTTADFCEFLQASAFEKDFSNLTLSDSEQRELYEAAKVIQKAYRSYKGRKKLEEEEKEKVAAVIIQNYYRRYKQYAYLRQVTQAALVIQNQYRNYCENKRFKKSPGENDEEDEEETNNNNNISSNKNPTNTIITKPFRTSQASNPRLNSRKQNQAAKKIQQFMRQSKNKLQKERAENVKPPYQCPY